MKKVYAGFWLRAIAFLIDSVIISIPVWILSIPVIGYMVFSMAPVMQEQSASDAMPAEMAGIFLTYAGLMLLMQVIWLVAFWLYFALFESSAQQATWGKQVLGIKVVDEKGQRISFGRATGRTFGKFISYLTFYIGFIMAGTTSRKQALHDFMAATLVVRKEVQPSDELPVGKNRVGLLILFVVLMFGFFLLPIVVALALPSFMGAQEKVVSRQAVAQLMQMKVSPDKNREPVRTAAFNYYYNMDGLRATRNNMRPYTLYLPQGSTQVCCEPTPQAQCYRSGLPECLE